MISSDQYLLIVDDNPNICKLLAQCLMSEGFTIRTALSGEQAIRAICIQKPQLIFMDFNMTGINGLETLKKVQSLIYYVPVIMISADIEPDVALEIKETGQARYFVPKPFDIKSLKQLVRQILASPSKALAIAN